MASGYIIDGPYNVRPKDAGEYFASIGEPLPLWFPSTVYETAPDNVIIFVDLNGMAIMRLSLGAAEHQ